MSHRPSVLDVVLLSSTATEKLQSRPFQREHDLEEAIKVLMAAHLGLLDETMSGDKMFLAMARAKKHAEAFGLNMEHFEEICDRITTLWLDRRKDHPLYSEGFFP